VPRAESNAADSVERFFQLSLLGLVASGYLAVAGSGYLDTPTIALTAAGLFLRALGICGLIRLNISERTTTAATVVYAAFFVADYFLLSRDFLAATVHLLFFLAVMKILTARTSRDYLYTAIIAFLELLAAAILSVNFNFVLFLSLYLLFAIAALTSGEIRRSATRATKTARNGSRRFASRLALLSGMVTAGILAMTCGLFFILPRTAEAAFARLFAHRIYLPGFSNQVTLGEIGEIKTSSRPVMHIKIFSDKKVPPLKWRGGVLTEFDGRRWINPNSRPDRIDVINDHVDLVQSDSWRPGNRINYHIDLEPLENDALFFAGTPEALDVRVRTLYRSEGSVFRLHHPESQGLHYDAYSLLEDRPETAPAMYPAPVLSLAARERALQLPLIDHRISELARTIMAGASTDLERARALERRLRTGYGYTLELPDRQVADPLAYFLFTRRKGHCEYFASAMTVMLRSQGIPARLATGFQSGIYNPVSDLWLVRAGDAHSWVEAWIPSHGWTTFDPTPPDPGTRGSLGFLTSLSLYVDAAETFWQEWVVTYDIARQGSLAGRVEQGAHRLGIRWFDSLASVGTGWNRYVVPAARRYGMWVVAAMAGAVLLWMGAAPLWRRMHWRKRVARVRRGQASVADATVLYERMLALLKRRGYQKPPWFTPAEFAASLPVSELGTAVGEFTATYNALRFGAQVESGPKLSALLERMEKGAINGTAERSEIPGDSFRY
jgi:transglutaminase-like putative cysteine protease